MSLPADSMNALQYRISPLTFLQVYRTTSTILESLSEQEIGFKRCVGKSIVCKAAARLLIIPLRYHLGTVGYGLFIDDAPAGWIFLRGRRQILHIDTLIVHPDRQYTEVAGRLLQFAEQSLWELGREWLSLNVISTDTTVIRLYESRGYRRGHWRLMSGKVDFIAGDDEDIRLRSLSGCAARQAYRQFTRLDLAAGENSGTAAQLRLLRYNRHRQAGGKHWIVTCRGEDIVYLNKYGSFANPEIYMACPPEWWGSPETITALRLVLNAGAGAVDRVNIHLGSSAHHDAARAYFESIGFSEQSMSVVTMFKHVTDTAPSLRS